MSESSQSILRELIKPPIFRANIRSIQYAPMLCARDLPRYPWKFLSVALQGATSFLVDLPDGGCFAVSVWVSPKRTRTYPYARIYNTLGYSGCRPVTVIPVVKDEGLRGDRDFVQWESVALMSLLGVYVVLTYYDSAIPSARHLGKITEQGLCQDFTLHVFEELTYYKSDALHWNLAQLERIQDIAEMAFRAYQKISLETGIPMHSENSFRRRIDTLYQSADMFKKGSRASASSAQLRELYTVQPKELTHGIKAGIIIENYLGGEYHFTVDEWHVIGDKVALLECKHTKGPRLPSPDDIKDGLLKMILWTNINAVRFGGEEFPILPVLNLTFKGETDEVLQSRSALRILPLLEEEGRRNRFQVWLNGKPYTP